MKAWSAEASCWNQIGPVSCSEENSHIRGHKKAMENHDVQNSVIPFPRGRLGFWSKKFEIHLTTRRDGTRGQISIQLLSNLHDVFSTMNYTPDKHRFRSSFSQHQTSCGLETRRFATSEPIQKDELILRYLKYRNDQCFFPKMTSFPTWPLASPARSKTAVLGDPLCWNSQICASNCCQGISRITGHRMGREEGFWATLGTVETQFLYGKKHMVPIESHSILGMNSAKHQE